MTGLQIECIGCAACIDACDEVMERLHRPRGLIRYDSLNGFRRPEDPVVSPAHRGLHGPSSCRDRRGDMGVLHAQARQLRGHADDRGALHRGRAIRPQPVLGPDRQQAHGAPELCGERDAGPWRASPASGFSGRVVVPPLGEIVEPLILQMPRLKYQGPFQVWMSVQGRGRQIPSRAQVEFLGPDARLLREEEAEGAHGAKPDMSPVRSRIWVWIVAAVHHPCGGLDGMVHHRRAPSGPGGAPGDQRPRAEPWNLPQSTPRRRPLLRDSSRACTAPACAGRSRARSCPAAADKADGNTVSTVYHVTRLTSYAVLGGIAGGLGRQPLAWVSQSALRWMPWLMVLFFVAHSRSVGQVPAKGGGARPG